MRTTCCPCGCGDNKSPTGVSRRTFLQGVGGATVFGAALTGLTWSSVAAAEAEGEDRVEPTALEAEALDGGAKVGLGEVVVDVEDEGVELGGEWVRSRGELVHELFGGVDGEVAKGFKSG